MSLSTKEYFIRETYKSIKRNGLMSLASVSTVALSLLVLGMFLLIFINTNNLAQYLESQVQITVYMEDSVEDTGKPAWGPQCNRGQQTGGSGQIQGAFGTAGEIAAFIRNGQSFP